MAFKWIDRIFNKQERLEEEQLRAESQADDGNMVLRTDGLVKKYRQRTVANHVSINVRQGEIVGLMRGVYSSMTTTLQNIQCTSAQNMA